MHNRRLSHTTVTVTVLLAAVLIWAGPGAICLAGADEPILGEGPPPINIDIKGGPIDEVLRMLGRAAGVDIVVNEGVTGAIPSMNLRDKTIEEALYLIAQTHGYLVYKVDNSTYIISPPGTAGPGAARLINPYGASPPVLTPTLPPRPTVSGSRAVTAAPAVLSATEIEPATAVLGSTRNGEQLVYDRIEPEYLDAAQVARGFGGGVMGTRSARRSSSPYVRSRVDRARAGGEALSFAGDLSAPGAPFPGGWGQYGMGQMGGSLGVGLGQFRGDQRYGGGGYGGYGGGGGGVALPMGMEPPMAILEQNVLLVHGTQEAIDQFREILAFFDKPPKQVEIEARFVEVETTKDKAFGIDWFVANGSAEFFNLGFAPGTGTNVARFRRGRFEAELRTLLTEGRAQVINAPRVTTQNNLEATVDFSTEIPYFYATISYNEFGQRTVDYQTETVSVSQSLTVMPRILDDDTIVLELDPEIDDQVGTVIGPNGEVLPIVSTQSVSTRVRVADGDTLVIGGFTRTNETFNIRKTPLLHTLPIIGNLFRSRIVADRQSELLIFVTPRILREIPRQ